MWILFLFSTPSGHCDSGWLDNPGLTDFTNDATPSEFSKNMIGDCKYLAMGQGGNERVTIVAMISPDLGDGEWEGGKHQYQAATLIKTKQQ